MNSLVAHIPELCSQTQKVSLQRTPHVEALVCHLLLLAELLEGVRHGSKLEELDYLTQPTSILSEQPLSCLPISLSVGPGCHSAAITSGQLQSHSEGVRQRDSLQLGHSASPLRSSWYSPCWVQAGIGLSSEVCHIYGQIQARLLSQGSTCTVSLVLTPLVVTCPLQEYLLPF